MLRRHHSVTYVSHDMTAPLLGEFDGWKEKASRRDEGIARGTAAALKGSDACCGDCKTNEATDRRVATTGFEVGDRPWASALSKVRHWEN
jgi:hypothetical protein